MENRNMMNLSARECRVKAKEILANSDRLWKNAGMQAITGDCGLAISLMVISIEELIKALVLTLDGAGFEFRKSPSVKRFFTDHHIRHVTSFMLLAFYVFGADAAALLRGRKFSADKMRALLHIVQKKDERLGRFLNCYLERKMHLLKLEMEWFSEMESYRQNGFYYDYDNDPINITAEDYLLAHEKLDKVRRTAMIFIETYQTITPENQKDVKQLIGTLRNENVYALLSLGIDKVKRNKEEAFDGLEKMFSVFKSR